MSEGELIRNEVCLLFCWSLVRFVSIPGEMYYQGVQKMYNILRANQKRSKKGFQELRETFQETTNKD